MMKLSQKQSDYTVFTLIWIVYASFVCRFWWICDDAFISFRYARNLVSGNGLRYNAAEIIPIEGYSNFLWVILSSIFEFFKLDITLYPLLISFVCGSILLYLIFTRLQKKFKLNLLTSVFGVLFAASSPVFALWSTSGLETMPFALLIFMLFDQLVICENRIYPVKAGITGIALALLRVEGFYWAIFIGILAIVAQRLDSGKINREFITYFSILLTGYALYFIIHYTYYRLPLPNSAYAKLGLNYAVLKRGLYYAITQFLTFPGFFVIFAGIATAFRRQRLAAYNVVLALPVSFTIYGIAVSGDFMPMARFLLPAVAFDSILFAWVLSGIGTSTVARKIIYIFTALSVIIASLLPAWNIHLLPQNVREVFHFRGVFVPNYLTEYEMWKIEKNNTERWTEKGKILKNYAKPGDTLVQGGIGAVGYYSNLFIYDRFGLVTRSVTLNKSDQKPLILPGHDKMVLPAFFVSEKPTYLWAHEATKPALHALILNESKSEIANQYIIDIIPMKTRNVEKMPLYLYIYKRIDHGIDTQTAWEKVIERVEGLNND